MQVSYATLRVCAAGYFAGHFFFEPLTPGLHLFGAKDPIHMRTLARCCARHWQPCGCEHASAVGECAACRFDRQLVAIQSLAHQFSDNYLPLVKVRWRT